MKVEYLEYTKTNKHLHLEDFCTEYVFAKEATIAETKLFTRKNLQTSTQKTKQN